MRHRISIRGSVPPLVRSSIRVSVTPVLKSVDASSCPDGLVSLHSHAIRANVGGGTSSGGSGNQSGNRETNDINASAIASATLQQVRITVLSNAFAASQRKREFINASTSTLEGCRNHDADPHLYCHCNYGFVNAIVISFENLSLFCHCFCILTAVKGDNYTHPRNKPLVEKKGQVLWTL